MPFSVRLTRPYYHIKALPPLFLLIGWRTPTLTQCLPPPQYLIRTTTTTTITMVLPSTLGTAIAKMAVALGAISSTSAAPVTDAADEKCLAVEARSETWYAGDVNMNEACRWQYGPAYWEVIIQTPPINAYSWRCTTGSGTTFYSVDVNWYCSQRYVFKHIWRGWASQEAGGVYDWRCLITSD